MAATLPVVNLSKETMDQIAPALQSMRDSMRNQTRLLQDTFNLQERAAQQASMRANLAQSQPNDASKLADAVDAGGKDVGGDAGGSSFFGILGIGSILGALSTGLAASIGSLVGVLTGQLGAVKYYAELFTPDKISKQFKGMRLGMAMNMELFKTDMAERMTKLSTSFNNTFDSIKSSFRGSVDAGMTRLKSFFTIAEDSNIGKTMASFKSGVLKITAPFSLAVTTLTDLLPNTTMLSDTITSIKTSVSATSTKFTGLLEPLKSFGSKVSGIAKVVGKVFVPIAILTTAWDTIKGALDGFAEDGILGGLQGAIDGFFTSLVTVPLDMVKNAAAWLLEKVGLISPETAEGVKDFSITEMFKSITDALFGIIGDAVDWIKDLFSFDPERMPSFGDFLSKTILLPYTLLQKAVGYIAGLFGFDEESEAIKSFNIGEEIMKVVTGVKDFVVDTFNHVVASIKAFDPMAALGDLGNMGKDFISALLRGVLPPPNVLTFDAPEVSIFGKKFGGGSINLNPIPDSVYRFAGLDAKTGDRIITNAGAGASAKAGLIENRAVDDTNTAKAAASANIAVNSAPTVINKGGNTKHIQVFSNPKVASQASFAGGF
jgi:hypothetical protein